MKKLIEFIKQNTNKNTAIVVLSLLWMPIIIMLISQIITLQGIHAVTWCIEHMAAFLLGWVLTLLPCLICYALTGKLFASWIVTALPSVIITLISYFKTEINGEPLMISEFAMTGEFGNIVQFAIPQLKFSPFTVIAIIIALSTLISAIWFDLKYKTSGKTRIVIGITGALILIVMEVFTLGHVWAKSVEGDAVTQAERVKECGVITGLYCAWVDSRVDIASDVTEDVFAQVNNLKSSENALKQGEKPNVIFLMSESFFDITQMDNLKFESDPVANFHAIAESYPSGKFISNTYCGGTGYVEMEVLTGICSFLLKETDTLPSLLDNVYLSMPSLSDVFDKNGYRKEFIHSHTNELYNRDTIYNALGFDSVRFSDSFPPDVEVSGGYISDMALAEEIVSIYENKGEEPLMLYAVSMENHQPYNADKYTESSGVNLHSDQLTKEDIKVLDNFVHGLVNADKALGYLTEYFADVDEPVMIVFWGDHLPNLTLPDTLTAYEKLGHCTGSDTTAWGPEELKKMLSTDYVIWTNYDFEEEDAIRGSTLFGLDVVKMLGLELTDYYLWLDEYLADKYTIYRPRLYVDRQGNASRDVPEEYKTTIDNYASVVYDMIYGENTLFNKYR